MYRHQQYESRFIESGHHEELPFFRQAVALIDSCTKLLKDDRIFLRNKIKEYLKVLRENRMSQNEQESEQMKQIIQIFIEANKKKSLSKIQKGDKAMDWLQIKLRKFVDNAKKEKHKREVQNFRKGKFIDIKKLLQPSRDRNTIEQESQPFTNFENSHYHLKKNQNKAILPHSSLSKSRQKDPVQSSRKRSQNNSYAQYSYHQSFGYLKKSKDKFQPSKDTKAFGKLQRGGFTKSKQVSQEKPSVLNRSLQHNSMSATASFKKASSKPKNNISQLVHKQQSKNSSVSTSRLKPNTQNNSKIQRNQIDRLTQLFSKHLNNASHEKVSENASLISADKQVSEFSNQNSSKLEPLIPLSSNRNEPSNVSFSRFEESTKKLQEMLDTSKHLFEQFSFNNSLQLKVNMPEPKEFNKKPSQDLFTPPEFLAECRKFLSNSSKKKQHQEPVAFDSNIDENDFGKKLTFSNVLRQSRERMQQKITELNQMTIHQVTSQNASVNISTKKPDSEVAFRFKNITINTAQDLLIQMFKKSFKATLDRYQLGEIMAKCSHEIEKLLQKYCDILSEQLGNATFTFEFQFVAIAKYFFSYQKILSEEDEHYSTFLCSILDMKQLGYLIRQNIEEFVESMQGSEIDLTLFNNIRTHLFSIYQRCCEIEGGVTAVTRWSLYYLQLTKDFEFQTLKELLSNFDFQIDMQEDSPTKAETKQKATFLIDNQYYA